MKNLIRKIWRNQFGKLMIQSILPLLLTAMISLITSLTFNLNFFLVKIEIWQVLILLFIIFLIQLILRSRYSDLAKNVDSIYFRKILDNYLNYHKFIEYIKNHDFAHPFPDTMFDRFNDFLNESENPSSSFHNIKLEKRRKQLILIANKLDHSLKNNTFPVGTNSQGLPKEWISNNNKNWTIARDEINKLVTDFCGSYSEFVKLGREIFEK